MHLTVVKQKFLHFVVSGHINETIYITIKITFQKPLLGYLN
jgi:hypothetical protein